MPNFPHRPLRRPLGGVLMLGAVLLTGCSKPGPDTASREVPHNVRLMPLETSPVTEYFEVSGKLEPMRGTDISSEESGTIDAIAHDKGSRVDEGDVIVALDRRLLAADLAAAEANLATESYNHDKTSQIFAAGKVSQLAMLQSDASLERVRSVRDVAQIRYDRAAVKAPYDGLVVDRMVEPGQLVAPGTVVARVIDPFTLKLEATVTESEVEWLRAGQTATVDVAGLPEPREARVGWVGFEADPQSGKFKLEIDVANADLALRSGVIARARLAKTTTRGLVVVPRDAVLSGQVGDEVYIVTGRRAVRRAVTLGPQQGLMVAVREGVSAGDSLVVRGQRELQDGSLVSVTETVAYGDGTSTSDPAVIKASAAATRVGAVGEVAQ